MNERVKKITRGVSKLACITMMMTLFTGYGSVFADESSDLNEKKTELEEKMNEITEGFMESMNEDNSSEIMCHNNIQASIYRNETQNGIRQINIVLANVQNEGKSLQIWAMKGGKHLLLKDYGVTMGVLGKVEERKRSFSWKISGDFQSVGRENVYRRNEEDILREYLEDRGDIGIYLKLKVGEEIKTYYKKISSNPVEQYDAYLITSYDTNLIKENKSMTMNDAKGSFNINQFENLNVGYMTQFPAIAVKGKSFGFGMIKEFSPCVNNKEFYYSIKIKGDNGYEREVIARSNRFNGKPHFWTPDEDGIFNIVVENLTSNEIISVRKIFVRKKTETDYLDLENLEVSKGQLDGQINITAEVDNFNADSQIKFRVGETFSNNIKTLKNYGQIDHEWLQDGNKINISNDARTKTLLGDGMYFVDALVKKNNSIEYEDRARKYYSKNDMADYFQLKEMPIPIGEGFEYGIINGRIKYRNDSNDYNPRSYIANKLYEVQENPDSGREEVAKRFYIKSKENIDITGEVEYKFLIWDARGKRTVRDYSEKNYLDYYFRDPGEYRVYGRIRRKDEIEDLEAGYMKNSYFQEVFKDIEVDMPGGREVFISVVDLDSYDVRYNNNNLLFRGYPNKDKPNSENKVLKAHTKNLIKIKAGYTDGEEGRLMYKVYAIHDGYWELITPYTASAVIPFYPRSTGNYKLLVLVKDSISGSDEVKMYIDAIAED